MEKNQQKQDAKFQSANGTDNQSAGNEVSKAQTSWNEADDRKESDEHHSESSLPQSEDETLGTP